MNESVTETDTDWIAHVRTNGWGAPVHLLLDVLEPLGPLGAQVMWVLQPALGVFVQRETLQHIAQTLEDPAAMQALRQQLDDTPDDTL